MKKITILIITMLLGFMLTGCVPSDATLVSEGSKSSPITEETRKRLEKLEKLEKLDRAELKLMIKGK